MTPLLAIALVVAALCFVFVVPPLLLKASCAVCSEKSPGFLGALAATYGAGFLSLIANLVYGVTLGLVVTKFSVALSVAFTIAISLFVTAVVFSAFLRVSVARGAKVAVVHQVFGWLIGGVIALIVHNMIDFAAWF